MKVSSSYEKDEARESSPPKVVFIATIALQAHAESGYQIPKEMRRRDVRVLTAFYQAITIDQSSRKSRICNHGAIVSQCRRGIEFALENAGIYVRGRTNSE